MNEIRLLEIHTIRDNLLSRDLAWGTLIRSDDTTRWFPVLCGADLWEDLRWEPSTIGSTGSPASTPADFAPTLFRGNFKEQLWQKHGWKYKPKTQIHDNNRSSIKDTHTSLPLLRFRDPMKCVVSSLPLTTNRVLEEIKPADLRIDSLFLTRLYP